MLDTRTAVHGVLQAVGEVVRVGSQHQRDRANEVLDQARRQLYRILADRD